MRRHPNSSYSSEYWNGFIGPEVKPFVELSPHCTNVTGIVEPLLKFKSECRLRLRHLHLRLRTTSASPPATTGLYLDWYVMNDEDPLEVNV